MTELPGRTALFPLSCSLSYRSADFWVVSPAAPRYIGTDVSRWSELSASRLYMISSPIEPVVGTFAFRR